MEQSSKFLSKPRGSIKYEPSLLDNSIKYARRRFVLPPFQIANFQFFSTFFTSHPAAKFSTYRLTFKKHPPLPSYNINSHVSTYVMEWARKERREEPWKTFGERKRMMLITLLKTHFCYYSDISRQRTNGFKYLKSSVPFKSWRWTNQQEFWWPAFWGFLLPVWAYWLLSPSNLTAVLSKIATLLKNPKIWAHQSSQVKDFLGHWIFDCQCIFHGQL